MRDLLPSAGWSSTACLLAGGFLLRRALPKVRRYERPALRAALGWVTVRALVDPRRYTPDYHAPVRFAAMYWQFLEACWLLVLATFLVV